MQSDALSILGGEFRDLRREAAFQAERCAETARHARLVFVFSAVLNTLFLFSDWRFYGTEHFFVAVPARLAVIAVSLVCFAAVLWPSDFRRLQRLMLSWSWVSAVGVAFLVSSRSDLALFVALMLPSIYYLVVPTAFRWTLVSGIGCSVLMMAGYMFPGPLPSTALGLILIMVMLNFALALVVTRSNRLRRLEWAATLAERDANEQLAQSRQMFERMYMAVPIPLVVTSKDSGRLISANDAAYTYFGATPETLKLASIEDVYVDAAVRPALLSVLEKHGAVGGFETKIRLADGSIRDILMAATLLNIGGAPSIMSGVVDITSRKAAEQQIRHAAMHDSLTGLPNRAHFQAHLEQVLGQAEARQHRVGVLLVDLDDFKEVNDTLGHDAGDALLIQISRHLRTVLPDGAFVARLGGDEFVVLVDGALQLEQIVNLAERMLEGLKAPIVYKDIVLSVRASIGVAVFPDHDRAAVELLKDADLALYAAKGSGRSRVAVYSVDLRRELEDRVAVARDIEQALAEGRIEPFYQPRICLKTGAVVGLEALARWHHPVRGLQTPAAFLSAFEHTELAVALGDTMVRQVAADMRRWLDEGIDFGRVAVNLSAVEFRDQNLAERLLGVLRAAQVPVERFAVEVTETVFLGRRSHLVAASLERFHEQGVRIALDDFGTGYASLKHLKQFPIDEIKIDRSFIRDIETDRDDANIVAAVVQLGRSLRMDVVAEGVETAGQAAFLVARGCTHAQGYFYAKPMPASRLPHFLDERPYLAKILPPDPEARRA